ncbi:LpxL/LpxP family Kdo(2)-lipid IV(A) lauroyl/palmitoleoyl acyltransferase [Aliikangiella coralliicola]|uniref:LpxL/LpxP family Kdo(2)-lipid IV(A) lauroyl/palmitoleoyl acyltransferase n=1 Tax=Aliikangiella coralliicola TaxID=2592383 RepID=A0A545UD35_9GAMM|nr:LpxL/LpxP family Kdo(2)-lipid IV(A) lauroyl/palmitoleoyl acyltransferase [Aliikangiella coralliicola]TQV87353.1 LpxL/LpxP family Kdo(2)-lipid IV(A) lauroyl/palmitoleoyl acyltransferase [Aliikangiella coralliicola]
MMTSSSVLPLSYFFKRPKYWLGLLFFGLAWLVAKLPITAQLKLADILGWLLLKLAKRRKNIAKTNLNLCFPDLTDEERESLLRKNFQQTALAIIETAACWLSDLQSRHKNTHIIGQEYLEQAQAEGNGVIVLFFHLTTMEIAGCLLGHHFDFNAMYKPNKNKLIERMMCNGRLRHLRALLTQNDARSTIKALKKNQTVWYSTDQNYGTKKGVFAPFFGIQASTITATTKFAKISGAKVVPFTSKRIDDGKGFELAFHPALENFPGDSPEDDAKRINLFLENYLKDNPVDYMWLHQRFRTRPPGEPRIYPKRK